MKRIASVVLLAIAALLVAVAALDRLTDPVGPSDAIARLAGKVLMVGFDGTRTTDGGVRRTLAQLERGEIAGVMFLRRNVRSRSQVAALTAALSAATKGPPALVALDQEGGRVARLGRRSGFGRTPSALAVARSHDPGEAERLYGDLAKGLALWGFNLNLAPVVDLHRGDNPIIGGLGRSFGADPATVTAYARAFLHAHERAGVLAAIKHFPGHGSSLGDTHERSVDVSSTWRAEELEPFRALATQAPLVMTGHIANRRLGANGPATLSKAVMTDLLRGRLGFRGVLVSDDLQMDAIADGHGPERAGELALRAGVDLLLYGNDARWGERVDAALVGRVGAHIASVARRDPAFEARLREAAARVDALRRTLRSPGDRSPMS